MKGLLLKEFLNLKWTLLYLVGFVGIYAVLFANTEGANMSTIMSTVMASMMTISTFSYDDLARWPKYALALPITKRSYVGSKYLFGGLMVMGGMVVALVFGVITEGLKTIPNYLLMWQTLYGSCLLAVLYVSFLLPIVLKFGAEKSRYIMLASMAVPALLIFMGSQLIEGLSIPMPSAEMLEMMIWLAPVLLVVVVGISVFVSIRIMEKKEL